MLSHDSIWSAIDKLAERNQLTPSGLARRAGLDPTSFNKSKRVAADGRMSVVQGALPATPGAIPLIGFAQAGAGGFFDDGGFPAGQGWDLVEFPASPDRKAGVYALEIQGDSMLPLYRDGDVLIVEPGAQVRRGDRVVVKTREGEVMAKVLVRQTAKSIELLSLNPEHPNRSFDMADVEWIARIIWASQ